MTTTIVWETTIYLLHVYCIMCISYIFPVNFKCQRNTIWQRALRGQSCCRNRHSTPSSSKIQISNSKQEQKFCIFWCARRNFNRLACISTKRSDTLKFRHSNNAFQGDNKTPQNDWYKRTYLPIKIWRHWRKRFWKRCRSRYGFTFLEFLKF